MGARAALSIWAVSTFVFLHALFSEQWKQQKLIWGSLLHVFLPKILMIDLQFHSRDYQSHLHGSTPRRVDQLTRVQPLSHGNSEGDNHVSDLMGEVLQCGRQWGRERSGMEGKRKARTPCSIRLSFWDEEGRKREPTEGSLPSLSALLAAAADSDTARTETKSLPVLNSFSDFLKS